MANDIKLQEGHPIDENLRPVKVGGETSALEISTDDVRVKNLQVSGTTVGVSASDDTKLPLAGGTMTGNIACADGFTLDCAGDINLTATNDINVPANVGLTFGDDGEKIEGTGTDLAISSSRYITIDTVNAQFFDSGVGIFHFRDNGDGDDAFKITVVGGTGATKLETVSDAADGDLSIVADGDIDLDSATGVFIAKKGGTEFSAANSAYAGMILGYTRIANTSSSATYEIINLSSTLTVIQTTAGTDVSITFVAPPSGNVEIQFTCYLYASSKTAEFALSDNSTFNEVAETHTYDAGAQSSDETDYNSVYIPFAVTGLTAGTSYTYYIGAAETVSGTIRIFHGANRGTGTHYPPITVKAVALPATITTGA